VARLLITAPVAKARDAPLLARMGLERARGLEARVARRLLLAALERTRDRRPLSPFLGIAE